jgi:hypothetical protein
MRLSLLTAFFIFIATALLGLFAAVYNMNKQFNALNTNVKLLSTELNATMGKQISELNATMNKQISEQNALIDSLNHRMDVLGYELKDIINKRFIDLMVPMKNNQDPQLQNSSPSPDPTVEPQSDSGQADTDPPISSH